MGLPLSLGIFLTIFRLLSHVLIYWELNPNAPLEYSPCMLTKAALMPAWSRMIQRRDKSFKATSWSWIQETLDLTAMGTNKLLPSSSFVCASPLLSLVLVQVMLCPHFCYLSCVVLVHLSWKGSGILTVKFSLNGYAGLLHARFYI